MPKSRKLVYKLKKPSKKKYAYGTYSASPDYSTVAQEVSQGDNRSNSVNQLAATAGGMTGSPYSGLGTAASSIAGGLVGGENELGYHDDTGDAARKGALTTGLSMAGQGAALGSMAGPIGTGVGAGVGLIGGGIVGSAQARRQNEAAKRAKQQADQQHRIQQGNMQYGGTDMTQNMRQMEDGMAEMGGPEEVEVERDELVVRNGVIVADFKKGEPHEKGGEDYTAMEGDVIVPGKYRKKVLGMADRKGRIKDKYAFNTFRFSKLPKDDKPPEPVIPDEVLAQQAAMSQMQGQPQTQGQPQPPPPQGTPMMRQGVRYKKNYASGTRYLKKYEDGTSRVDGGDPSPIGHLDPPPGFQERINIQTPSYPQNVPEEEVTQIPYLKQPPGFGKLPERKHISNVGGLSTPAPDVEPNPPREPIDLSRLSAAAQEIPQFTNVLYNLNKSRDPIAPMRSFKVPYRKQGVYDNTRQQMEANERGFNVAAENARNILAGRGAGAVMANMAQARNQTNQTNNKIAQEFAGRAQQVENMNQRFAGRVDARNASADAALQQQQLKALAARDQFAGMASKEAATRFNNLGNERKGRKQLKAQAENQQQREQTQVNTDLMKMLMMGTNNYSYTPEAVEAMQYFQQTGEWPDGFVLEENIKVRDEALLPDTGKSSTTTKTKKKTTKTKKN